MKSDSGQKEVGRPDAALDGGFLFKQYCGGMGGAGCLPILGIKGIVIPYKMPRFIVRHKRILFENKEFNGVRIYTDAGAAGLCDHTIGSEVGFYLMLSAEPVLSGEEIMQRGQFLMGELPYDIEFLAKDIPQPKDSNYDGYIYMHYFWGSESYINEGGAIDEYSMRIKKHDYDIQL